MMMMAGGCGGGGGAAAATATVVDHIGMLYSGPSPQSLQQPLMEAESADSRKRPLESSTVEEEEEEAGCTKRTNIRGKEEVHARTYAPALSSLVGTLVKELRKKLTRVSQNVVVEN